MKRRRGDDALRVQYQPIVNPLEGLVLGYEALVRAERSRTSAFPTLVDELGEMKSRGGEVLRVVANGIPALPEQSWVFVNVRLHELLDDELYSDANPLLAHARRIVIELTENVRIDSDGIESRLQELRSLGFGLAVNDVGTGELDLSSLITLEPNFAKIDGVLVREIDRSPMKRMLVSSLVTVCRRLRIQLVGEGVETKAEGSCLLDLGVELLQGYFFAEPKPSFGVEDGKQLAERIERLDEMRARSRSRRAWGQRDTD